MRINQFIARALGISRRSADTLIADKRIKVNGSFAELNHRVTETDNVTYDDKPIRAKNTVTIKFNKPRAYVTSRDGQGSMTIYDLLPVELHHLKPVGRLDKYSSGLMLLTNDGQLANKLTHPSFEKQKKYDIRIDRILAPVDQQKIINGVELNDGPSKLQIEGEGRHWQITMYEGRNKQIRRTFDELGYKVERLHRTQFGSYKLNDLQVAKFVIL